MGVPTEKVQGGINGGDDRFVPSGTVKSQVSERRDLDNTERGVCQDTMPKGCPYHWGAVPRNFVFKLMVNLLRALRAGDREVCDAIA